MSGFLPTPVVRHLNKPVRTIFQIKKLLIVLRVIIYFSRMRRCVRKIPAVNQITVS